MYYNELYTRNITGSCLVHTFALYLVDDINTKLPVELNGVRVASWFMLQTTYLSENTGISSSMNDSVSRVAVKALMVSICNPYYMMIRKVRLMKTINGNFCGFTK